MAALTFDIFPVPPMLWIPNQQELAYNGQDVVLVCHIEAYPKSINYWTTAKGDMIISGIYDHKKRKEKKEPGPHNGTISGVKQKENSFLFFFWGQVTNMKRFLQTIRIASTCGSRSVPSDWPTLARTSAWPRIRSEKPTAPSNFTVRPTWPNKAD